MTTADYIFQVIALLGGLALFLFGMDYMGASLEKQAGGKLQTILAKMSATPLKGFFLGLAVTAVIQSSSATTVMVVGFVNSGIMKLSQAVGVIMGSNVGTTVTAWILSLTALEGDSFWIRLLKPDSLSPLLGLIGIILYMFCKSERKKGVGSILLGFMALMTGMALMNDSMAFLKHEAWFQNLMLSFSGNPLLGVLTGAVVTGIIQSSSASVGILQGLCSTGAVTGGTALPIIMGQNIGTCVTALLSTVGANTNAKRTAMVHLYFNMIGVTVFLTVFYVINIFFPWGFLNETMDAANIAVIHTVFNILTTCLLLPLNQVLLWLVNRTVRENTKEQQQVLLDERLIATPAVAVQQSYDVAAAMADVAVQAYCIGTRLLKSYDENEMKELYAAEDKTDAYEDALSAYLVRLSEENMSAEDNRTLNTLLYTIGDFERIADHAVSLGETAKEMKEKKVSFSKEAMAELAVLQDAVSEIVACTYKAYAREDVSAARLVEPSAQVVALLVRECKSRHIARLRGGMCTVEYGFILDDILTSMERIVDRCASVAAQILQKSMGRSDIHAYMDALKKGELEESMAFKEQFEKQKKKYAFS